jgi:glycosyltransferase involved in cell wall biosynthesis
MSHRVAVVAACPFPARRGTPLRIERLTAALAARGHAVEVFSYHVVDDERLPPLPATRTRKRIVRRHMPPGPRLEKLLLDPLLCYQLGKGLRRGFDVIHAHHVEGLLVARCASRRGEVPVVFDAHTLLASELPTYSLGLGRRALRALGWWLDGALPRRADQVIAVTRQMRDLLVTGHGLAEDRVSMISNGVEIEHFASADGRIAAEPGRLIYTGTLAPYQGSSCCWTPSRSRVAAGRRCVCASARRPPSRPTRSWPAGSASATPSSSRATASTICRRHSRGRRSPSCHGCIATASRRSC